MSAKQNPYIVESEYVFKKSLKNNLRNAYQIISSKEFVIPSQVLNNEKTRETGTSGALCSCIRK